MDAIKLKGITWGHTRGLLPLVATGQRFTELHPLIEIQWTKRSLQEFADQSIQALARDYDLLVIDHPSIGEAHAKALFLPLDQFINPVFMRDQAAQSVGQSHVSYQYANHQWALAIDAATPVSAARLDVLAAKGHDVPQTWEEMMELAKAGLIAFAGLKLDCLMHFYMLCINEGVILVYLAMNVPFTIWLIDGFFRQIPQELSQAAQIDGCTAWQAFWKVEFPLARGGIAAAAIFAFLTSWNEFALASQLTRSPKTKTMPVALMDFTAQFTIDWAGMCAMAVLIIVPALILTFLVQKHLITGLTMGGVKG
jgi:hypothetical protein